MFDWEYILVAEDWENLRSNNQNICNLVCGKFWVNNHAYILKANNENVTKYLFYNFNRINFINYITWSAQPKLNKENLLNIKTFVHSKQEQQKIYSILSNLDSKIELNNKINSELEKMAKSLYDYWFIQFDFPDKNWKPYKSSSWKMIWNEELKREIPEGWKVGNLKENSLTKLIKPWIDIFENEKIYLATADVSNNDWLEQIKLIIPNDEFLKNYHEKTYWIYKKIYLNQIENQKLTENLEISFCLCLWIDKWE